MPTPQQSRQCFPRTPDVMCHPKGFFMQLWSAMFQKFWGDFTVNSISWCFVQIHINRCFQSHEFKPTWFRAAQQLLQLVLATDIPFVEDHDSIHPKPANVTTLDHPGKVEPSNQPTNQPTWHQIKTSKNLGAVEARKLWNTKQMFFLKMKKKTSIIYHDCWWKVHSHLSLAESSALT